MPARMGVLAVPKLGPPAQDLIGAVLPTAAGHAWGRVIDFKSAGRQEERVGGGRRMPSTPGVRAQEQGRGPGRRHAHTISPAPAPWISGSGAQCQDKVGQDREKDKGQQLPPPRGSPTGPSSLLQCFSEELVGAMIVLKHR